MFLEGNLGPCPWTQPHLPCVPPLIVGRCKEMCHLRRCGPYCCPRCIQVGDVCYPGQSCFQAGHTHLQACMCVCYAMCKCVVQVHVPQPSRTGRGFVHSTLMMRSRYIACACCCPGPVYTCNGMARLAEWFKGRMHLCSGRGACMCMCMCSPEAFPWNHFPLMGESMYCRTG